MFVVFMALSEKPPLINFVGKNLRLTTCNFRRFMLTVDPLYEYKFGCSDRPTVRTSLRTFQALSLFPLWSDCQLYRHVEYLQCYKMEATCRF